MIERRSPFEGMDRLFEGMQRAMAPAWSEGTWAESAVRMERTDEGYVVLADLPGFEREEIDLRFDDGYLTIAASHEEDAADSFRSRHVSERVHVPGHVDLEDVAASYRNGVLEVSLPVHDDEDEDTHRINIE